jgi:hypothetical protein
MILKFNPIFVLIVNIYRRGRCCYWILGLFWGWGIKKSVLVEYYADCIRSTRVYQ